MEVTIHGLVQSYFRVIYTFCFKHGYLMKQLIVILPIPSELPILSEMIVLIKAIH